MRLPIYVAISLAASAVFTLGCDGSRSVDPSMDVSVDPTAARATVADLAGPSNVSAAPLATAGMKIQWQDNSSTETAFEIQRSSSGESGAYDVVASLAANSVAYEDIAVNAASQYCYRIRAVRVSGKKAAYSPFSNISCASTATPTLPDMPSTPAAPSNVIATPSSESMITVTWQDNSTDETGFAVSTVGFNPFAWVGANIVTALSYALSQGVTYCYQVQAYHSKVTSDGVLRTVYSASDTACAIIPVPTSPPAGSYAITVKPADGSLQLTLVWTGVSNPPANRIYRSTDNGSTWVQTNDGIFVDSPFAGEQRACYYVIAYNAAGDGPPSNTACASTVNAPSDLIATSVDAETLELRWSDNSSVEDGYQIFAWVLQGSPDNAGMSEYEDGPLADLPANATTARLPKITPYPYSSVYYFVVAKKDGGRSLGSNQVDAMVSVP